MSFTQSNDSSFQYFYSIKDISIGGRCLCNGHAAACDVPHPTDPSRFVCRCEHNTCGQNCERCCDGFTQKEWQPAMSDKTNECERKMTSSFLKLLFCWFGQAKFINNFL